MQSKNNAPNVAQKRWREEVRGLGSIVSLSGYYGRTVIHHPVGQSAKIKGVGNIGNWWVIPLTEDLHEDLHNGEKFGFETRKEWEKYMFADVMKKLYGHPDSPSDEVLAAIRDYRR